MTNEELVELKEFAQSILKLPLVSDYEQALAFAHTFKLFQAVPELIDEVIELRYLIHDLQEEKGLLPSIDQARREERDRLLIILEKSVKQDGEERTYKMLQHIIKYIREMN